MTGCQAAPKKQAVVGKNSFSLNATQPEGETIPSQFQYKDDFTSTDGSVQFHIDISQTMCVNKMPAVEVVPMCITSEDAQRVAKVLLGDVVFYEREPSSNPQYSKSQYQEMIANLAPYSNLKAMTELVGEDNAEDTLASVKDTISRITEMMETAPEKNPHKLCDWTLKKERVYNDSEWDIGERPMAEDNDWLVATAEKDGLSYKYMVVARNQEDYKLNRFYLQLGGASVDTYMERSIYWSQLCRTGNPTQQQKKDAQDRVIELLEEMELGDWEIADTQVEIFERGTEPEYMLRIYAVPVFKGIPAVYGQKNIAKAADYSGAYVLTQANFLMSANGDLIEAQLDSPLMVSSLVNENVATLPLPHLMERAQQNLSLSDAGNYGIPSDQLEEEIRCYVNISQLEYGLARIMKENTTDSYYYVPALMIRGNVEYRDKNTGDVYYSDMNNDLLLINAVDGSIIE